MRGKKEYKKIIDRQFSTKSHQRIWTHFTDLVNTKNFQNFVETTRKESMILYDETIGYYRSKNAEIQVMTLPLIAHRIKEFCEQNTLHYTDFVDIISHYIQYDKVIDPSYFENAFNLCIVEDSVDRKEKSDNQYWIDSDDKMYPLSIRFNPDISQNDLIDFIKKTYQTHIEPRQKRSQNVGKIKKTRIRSQAIKNRDQYILDNPQLDRKKLMDKANQKFDDLVDYAQVGNIINKKRS